jgi:hypothetical protein
VLIANFAWNVPIISIQLLTHSKVSELIWRKQEQYFKNMG